MKFRITPNLWPSILLCLLVLSGGFALLPSVAAEPDAGPEASESTLEDRLLSQVRQLTYAGARAGEGYFSPDGKTLIFQSERDEANPFYQIYALDLETGESWRVSPGQGKTTCAWILPTGEAIFSSTHEDPEVEDTMREEFEFRASGEERRYTWDYDEHYEIYKTDLQGGAPIRLTDAPGYDAEASASPDGNLIVFSSTRSAYEGDLSPELQDTFERDKSYFADIYVMNADGSDLRRLTDTPGYDGGPFFSPDGARITWRRFSEDGATAEIYTMNADGTDPRRITSLGAMSWAPYYHPSGQYIIFATNRHGFDNFELYMVDTEGRHEPVRVTYTPGFDGLPVFSPDGGRLAWTTTRTPDKSAQIFLAEWNHDAALDLLGLSDPDEFETVPEIRAEDMRVRIGYLASEKLQGRLTGTEGERLATEYAAEVFKALGLEPAGDNGTYFQSFEFTAGVSLGDDNRLALTGAQNLPEPKIDENWRPLAFSKTGRFGPAGVVFAGYGIVAPADGSQEEYDSYAHLDVAGKWVMVFRYMPEDVTPERRQFFNRYASVRHKAMVARDRGAVGLIVVSGPNSDVKEPLMPLRFDTSLAGSSIAALSFDDEMAAALLKLADRDLKGLQDALDTGEPVMGFDFPGLQLEARIDIRQEKRTGRSVLGRLNAGDAADGPAVVVGAHIDHLGRGVGTQSLARSDEEGQIHYGADDNASGTAAVLEIAEHLKNERAAGRVELAHDVIFALWSGEELGLLGSSHYVRELTDDGARPLPESVVAYFNMDMIGRMQDSVLVHGVGSSSVWPFEIERANAPLGLPVQMQNDPYIPTDSTAFYVAGVPFVNAFTGVHSDYHSPRDTADKINYEDAARIARLMARLVTSRATQEAAPDYKPMEQPDAGENRAGLRVYLGSIPDYSQTDSPGVRLSGVANGGPAEAAGVRAGDSIVELAGQRIENIYDYTYAMQGLKVGEPVGIVVLRGDERLELTITPGSRE